ncbi:MAG: hypothetical protein ACRBG0_24900 [Lewinella sp.]|jgi:hypothetical protein|uniref:hypothetical protein n=1 Tax=Lewinella sp. TaxID=2004506 RepID=UPI003D6C1D6A
MRIALAILGLSLFFFACDPYAESDLAGNWEAIRITEEGDSLAVDLSGIRFEFTNNGRYYFHSTLNYEEAGTYRLDGPYLFSTDTTQEISREKAVEIVLLNTDSLQLRMQELGKERVMLLKKE